MQQLKSEGSCGIIISSANDSHSPFVDEKVMQMMTKMGYKEGTGLGKEGKGQTQPINVIHNTNTRGLGFTPNNDFEVDWDILKEDVVVKELLYWMENDTGELNLLLDQLKSYLKFGHPDEIASYNYDFCNPDIFDNIIKGKNIFDEFRIQDLNRARARANPFEKIRSVFFMNRAALKLANIDAATNFMFSNVNENEHHCNSSTPFYFADVCAGPGGFTEYILWRKGWLFKGFGLTLKDENDFDFNKSCCISPHSFQAFYGSAGDGDVCNPKNIDDFRDKVLSQTDGKGVHFMTSDGGFCVEGRENFQEILSKNIYLCQCLVALEIVRTHGHFVTKLFDVFTRFSVGLIYLMYKCFEKVCILKPNSSRPANAERYLICCNLQDNRNVKNIKKYLQFISSLLWEKKDDCDVSEIVSFAKMKADTKFFEYIKNSNNTIGKSQIRALKKLGIFCQNNSLYDCRQDQIRDECLEYWKIPDISKRKMQLETKQKNSKLKSCLENNVHLGSSTKSYKWKNDKWDLVEGLKLTRGTLLYGEIVKEFSTLRRSLHIIDAVFLGEMDLRDLAFEERMRQISIYAQSVNSEFQENLVRIRKKRLFNLDDAYFLEALVRHKGNQFSTMVPACFQSKGQHHYLVKSLLFLQRSEDLKKTFISRIHLSLEDEASIGYYLVLKKHLEKNSKEKK